MANHQGQRHETDDDDAGRFSAEVLVTAVSPCGESLTVSDGPAAHRVVDHKLPNRCDSRSLLNMCATATNDLAPMTSYGGAVGRVILGPIPDTG